MPKQKIKTTIQWEVDLPEGEFNLAKFARKKLESVFPHDFKILKVNVPGRKKFHLETLAEFTLEDIFDRLTTEESRLPFEVDDSVYNVRMNSHRYFFFKQNHICVACGLAGEKFLLQQNPCDKSPHFNLYGVENDELILMTKDHVLPKSKGGKNSHDNYVTMCIICNNLKANYEITPDQIRELRSLKEQNPELPKKQLGKLISHTREKMAHANMSALQSENPEL
ncbi:MAG: hypothetical protein DWQ19_09510 [Crenarchaeota archaeon]|nr:MAG: hypothetical protein DWQ19_09510 [Thermoproteota archaeon]